MNDCDPPAYSQTEDESSALPPSYEEAAKGRPRWVTENMEAKHRLIQEILNVPRQLPADRESSMYAVKLNDDLKIKCYDH